MLKEIQYIKSIFLPTDAKPWNFPKYKPQGNANNYPPLEMEEVHLQFCLIPQFVSAVSADMFARHDS